MGEETRDETLRTSAWEATADEKEKGLFPWRFTGEETGKQLAGTYCISKRVEGTS